MERQLFDEVNARALVGTRVRTRVEFSGVPVGTAGQVVRADRSGDGYTLGVEWELTGRTKPLVDWFSRSEYERFLAEVSR